MRLAVAATSSALSNSLDCGTREPLDRNIRPDVAWLQSCLSTDRPEGADGQIPTPGRDDHRPGRRPAGFGRAAVLRVRAALLNELEAVREQDLDDQIRRGPLRQPIKRS